VFRSRRRVDDFSATKRIRACYSRRLRRHALDGQALIR
jgi:hypothetical protein